MKPSSKPLSERIETLRAEIEEFISARTKELKAQHPLVPEVTLRQMIERQAPGCPCQQALTAMKEGV